MSKKSLLALLALAIAGCSADAPSEQQVMQALSDHYTTAQGGAELQRALDNEVAVNDCRKSGEEYRCLIENKALGSSTPMYFAYDKSNKKWRYIRSDSQ